MVISISIQFEVNIYRIYVFIHMTPIFFVLILSNDIGTWCVLIIVQMYHFLINIHFKFKFIVKVLFQSIGLLNVVFEL